MKTLIIYFEEFPKYLIVDGDYTKFHNLVVNGSETDMVLQDDFCKFFYDTEGRYVFTLSEDISIVENKQWDKVALITFLL